MKGYCLLLLLFSSVLTVSAQRFEPNTKWPYIYQDFTDGTIYFTGDKKSEAKLNIHLWGNKLHYISGDQKILESNEKGIIRVEIGSDAYIYCDRQLVKVLAAEQNQLLVEESKADFDALFSSTGAYGASLNSASARDLSSLDLGGLNNPELGLMLQERNDGSALSVRTRYYFVINGKMVEANKKQVEQLLNDSGKKEWKTFQKQNKIKWKKEDSLKQVLSFVVKSLAQ